MTDKVTIEYRKSDGTIGKYKTTGADWDEAIVRFERKYPARFVVGIYGGWS